MAQKSQKKKIALWKRMPIRLVVIAGQKKAGKDAFIQYVKRHYAIPHHYRIAEAPAQIATLLGLPRNRAIYQKLFEVNALLYPLIGESAYKRRVAHLIDSEKPHLAIVEAVRTFEEYKEFVTKRKGILVGITAPDQLRYQRALEDTRRGSDEKSDEGKMTFKEFMKRETVPIERDIRSIVHRADFVIENRTNDYQPFYKNADVIMQILGVKRRREKR
jgi:hypothetical protein